MLLDIGVMIFDKEIFKKSDKKDGFCTGFGNGK